jgi:hypothetical protein
MSATPQTALDRYKARREGIHPEATTDRKKSTGNGKPTRLTWGLLGTLVLTCVFAVWINIPHPEKPIDLTYEIDLQDAPRGSLIITVFASGEIPEHLDLEFSPGIFMDGNNGVTALAPTAQKLHEDGSPERFLPVDETTDGWRVHTKGASRLGFIYRIDMAHSSGLDQDIRNFISTPVSGGIRAAGYEIFLEPTNVPVESITVTMHNPLDLQVLVPWPALVRKQDEKTAGKLSIIAQNAHLGYSQGFTTVASDDRAQPDNHNDSQSENQASPVPSNLFFHPEDLADLNNALLICGDIRISSEQAKDTIIQYATDQQWLFSDEEALQLIRRIARTEMGFFGSSPTPQITVLLASNDVRAEEGFDVYGVHTGSSVLVMIGEETTYGELEGSAASVIAHEMFHGWLGEAIPQVDPTTLWFTEGATTWYASRMLAAAGIWSPEHARKTLGLRLRRDYVDSPLLGKMDLATAAAQVMGEARQVRFAYAGGVAACMGLDQMLSAKTGMEHPLDEVLRYMYDNRDGSALSRTGLEAAILVVTGIDAGPWLDAFAYGTNILPPLDRLI